MTLGALPLFLQRRSSDEYRPEPYSEEDHRVIARTRDEIAASAPRVGAPARALMTGRPGTAAGLRALNATWGSEFYRVPEDAVDDEAAAAVFDGPEVVIDVQTHFMAPHAIEATPHAYIADLYSSIMPDWWTDIAQTRAYDLSHFIQKVFVETESAVAILTASPMGETGRLLFNDEMAATRSLVDAFAGPGRLLNHAIVMPSQAGEIDAMGEWLDSYAPVGWKAYTANRPATGARSLGWMLDDEEHGLPFVERARDLGVGVVCIHKGISKLLDNGSPRDVGPVAKAFPDVDFLVYHSGYEFPLDGAAPEGPYLPETAGQGVNRLVATASENGIGPGDNVYAELGTTWFSLVRRPVEAAHVLGKLIAAFGEDNVIWGTDSIWYGSAQPLIDAFRAFQIPDAMCEEFGYHPLTDQTRAKILGLNAARVYGIDVEAARRQKLEDDRSWAVELAAEYRTRAFDALR